MLQEQNFGANVGNTTEGAFDERHIVSRLEFIGGGNRNGANEPLLRGQSLDILNQQKDVGKTGEPGVLGRPIGTSWDVGTSLVEADGPSQAGTFGEDSRVNLFNTTQWRGSTRMTPDP